MLDALDILDTLDMLEQSDILDIFKILYGKIHINPLDVLMGRQIRRGRHIIDIRDKLDTLLLRNLYTLYNLTLEVWI